MRILLIASLFCLLLFGCQKEIGFETLNTNPNNTSKSCLLLKTYSYSLAGTILDSGTYTYSGNKLVKISSVVDFDSVLFQYTGNNITKRSYYQSGVLFAYDNLVYNADGTLRLIEQLMDSSVFGSGWQRTDSIVFSYNTGKLVKRGKYILDPAGPSLVLDEENKFEYTGNNITKSIFAVSNDTTLFQYDSQPNFVKAKGFSHLAADLNFMSPNTIADYYVTFLSENNPVKVWDSQFPSGLQNVTYHNEPDGKFIIKTNNDPLFAYKFSCP